MYDSWLIVEYARRALRLSFVKATSEPRMIVVAATQASHVALASVPSRSRPKTYTDTFRIVNTPTLTTATACRSAETGVGATIAAGSHRWNGITAAFPAPKTNRINNTLSTPFDAVPARMPPSRKSSVPASCHVQMIARS